jgi:hypothetical protein
MSEIDRRSLIGVAGASMLVVACNEAPGGKKNETGNGQSDKGYDYNFGQPVTAKKPDPQGDVTSFTPKYLCVIYMRMESNGEFTVRHGYEPYPGAAEERSTVEAMLKQAKTGNWAHAGGENNKRREHNFDEFSQNSQQRIWLFVDNKPTEMAFEDRNGDDYIIRFSPKSGVDPDNKLPKNTNRKHYRNNAFFNINVIKDLAIPGLQGKTLISLDYWNTDDNGNDIKNRIKDDISTHHLFSINIHLKLAMSKKAGPNQWLPMIVDPDGGNMGGTP